MASNRRGACQVLALPAVLAAGFLALLGCGDDQTPAAPQQPPAAGAETDADDGRAPVPRGIEITVGESEFGDMLFDSRRQAIYVFEKDPDGRSVCYGECAEAWPPVLTDGEPVAGKGLERSLLGTVERRGGALQVTYAGRPLYFYAHEQPGEVRCHNVELNGGLWWVVGPDGRPRP